MHGEKHRLRFEKTGNLRLLSHLDLMRSVERLCRRADVPFKLTQGFHPAPRIVLAMALPLGAAGLSEVMEIELTETRESQLLLERLNAHTPIGLRFLDAYAVSMSTNAMARRSIYQLELTAADHAIATVTVPQILAQDNVWASRLKPRPRQIDIRPYIRNIELEANTLTLDLWVTPYGTARADELIALLGLPSPIETGAAWQRSELELHDEVYDGLTDAPPAGRPHLRPLEPSSRILPDETEPPTMATWGMSPNGPEVE